MNRMSFFFQIITKNIFKPKNLVNLAKEKVETQDDINHKTHEYEYNFNSIEEFFKNKFHQTNLTQYESELNELEEHVKVFFKEIDLEKYPSAKKPYPSDYSINPNARKFLYLLCRILKPKIIVETGVAYGLSSFYILKALEKNNLGKLYSIDSVFRPWQTERMIGSIIPQNLKERWTLVLGTSNKKLQQVFDNLEDVDIFIHDSLHTYKNMMFEFECAINKLRQGIIISDDILENDAFHDFTREHNVKNSIINVKDKSGLGIIETT